MILSIKKNSDVFLVSFVIIMVSFFGQYVTRSGLDWYSSLIFPPLTPPNWLFGVVWPILYLLSACAAIILVRVYKHIGYYYYVRNLFILIALLNPLWSYLFFAYHTIGGALINCIVLEFTVITLIAFAWHDARSIALLMLPTAGWIAFAIYLNYSLLLLN